MSHDKTPRERAESHFSKMPTPSSARERAFEELDAMKAVRDENIQNLREARLARDLQDSKTPAPSAPVGRQEP